MSTKKTFDVKMEEEGQKLAALEGNAAAFQHAGGAPLMITEHVENGIDAIKQNKKTSADGGTNFTGMGQIDIIIDDRNREAICIDNGTGILKPIWIIEYPFKSLKTGADYTGQYGRGLHGFRGFCSTLEYITLRNQPSERETSEGQPGEDQRCVKVTFRIGKAKGDYEVIDPSEFRKYCKHNTGTVAILKDWLPNEYENFVNKKDKLENRTQHHFGKELETKMMEINITRNKHSEPIKPREFTQIPFDIPELVVKDPDTKEEYGKIKFSLYQTSAADPHEYKKPYLIVQGRPLQNSYFADMEEFKDNPIWKSHYLTGYIECDFIQPNQLRIAIEPGKKKKAFVEFLYNFARFELKQILKRYIDASYIVKREEENREIIIDIQRHLKKMKIPIDLKGLDLRGKLGLSDDSGDKASERLSDIPGDDNEGRIVIGGTEEALISYEKQKRRPPTPPGPDDDLIIDVILPGDGEEPKTRPHIPSKDGRSQKVVTIDSKLFSKGGRKRTRALVGPGIGFQDEELNPLMSWYEASQNKVIVNSKTETYNELEKRSRKSVSETGAYDKKLKNFVSERYLWEVIMNLLKDKSVEERGQIFWEVYHKYFLHKDTT